MEISHVIALTEALFPSRVAMQILTDELASERAAFEAQPPILSLPERVAASSRRADLATARLKRAEAVVEVATSLVAAYNRAAEHKLGRSAAG